MTQTFYDLLGVSEDASTADIEAAYRAAIKRVHPDVSDDVDASERTKRLNKAKAVLTDERERRRYDRSGHDAYVSGGSAGADAAGSADAGSGDAGSSETDDEPTGRGRESGNRTAQGAGSARSSDGGSFYRGGSSRSSGGRSGDGSTSRTSDARSTDAGSATWAGRGRWRKGRRESGSHEDSSGRGAGPVGSTAADGATGGRRRSASAGPQSRDRTGPSRASPGPAWQSNRPGGGPSFAANPAGGSSTRGGSRTRDSDGSTVDWSWNDWDRNRSWAVREGPGGPGGLRPERLVPDEQSVLLLLTTFILYPFFVVSVLLPAFPLVARVAVGVCTLLMFAYLLSVPEIAIVVFGLWSLLLPPAIWYVPGIGVFSLAGVVGLSVTWIPLGLSILTLSVLRG